MAPNQRYVNPRLYSMPASHITRPGTYIEVETQRRVNVLKLPVSGIYIVPFIRHEDELVQGYMAKDTPHTYSGPFAHL